MAWLTGSHPLLVITCDRYDTTCVMQTCRGQSPMIQLVLFLDHAMTDQIPSPSTGQSFSPHRSICHAPTHTVLVVYVVIHRGPSAAAMLFLAQAMTGKTVDRSFRPPVRPSDHRPICHASLTTNDDAFYILGSCDDP